MAEARAVETSVLIRCFNEQKYLPGLFDALDRQTYRDFEVIIVDSGSFDRTREIAEARADTVLRISSHDFTFGYSLNAGIKAARGKFIAIVSAHTEPCDEHWLETLIAPLRDATVAMTYGRQLGKACSKFSETEDFERTFGPRPREESPARWCVNNANSAIRRDLWEKYPFDEELTGLEDIDWARRWMTEGLRVVYRPEARLYHIHEESWRQIRRRYYREAVAARRMGIKGPDRVLNEAFAELRHTVSDLVNAFSPGDNPVAARLTLGQRLREVVYFRVNRNIGTFKGLLEAHPLETRAEQEDALFDRSTRAVVIHGPGKVALENIELPELKPGDVVIRTAHVGVCATDLELLAGSLGYYKSGMAKYPIVPGHEFSGRIVTVGQNVIAFKEGDPVVVECIQSCGSCGECRAGNFIGCAERAEVGVLRLNGAYADFVTVPARFVHRLAPGTDLRQAALCEPTAVVLKGMRRLMPALEAQPNAERRCAVIGAGCIGHICAVELARRGHAVTVFDRNAARLEVFKGRPIQTSADLDRLGEFNVVVEATGHPEVLDKALHAAPAGATLLLLGLPYARKEFSFEAIAAFDKTVIGSVGSTAEDFAEAIRLMPELDLSALMACSLPLSKFAEAWELARAGSRLKIILDVEDRP
ncbi:alcohol dehydrogenase catalytic domain-containing protein [Paramagnetospirillum marisnigri]|uniref:alcohol dehydrogenase catalytic domain-containing protein n=1 Tax=Paramagnetospirillum marisnigri TaxID=1285242 RepID=UPI001560086F|nr:alcohol dehydrogenase catalytic domain-containing protein [Paramagnetospirillum marisnigri]